MAKPTRKRVRKVAPARKIARPRAYTHRHFPVSRRYTYTPELLAEGRRRYERTEDRIVDIAADFGIHKTTFQRMANDKGWVRYAAPPRDLSRSAKLAAEAEALEQAALRHPEERAQRASKGDGQGPEILAVHPSRLAAARLAPQDDGAVTPGIARTRSVNAFPRTSKFGYWSNEAQAGDSSTTGSFRPEASASRAAASIAADSTLAIS